MFIKYFTSDIFRKEEFCEVLRYECNVKAAPTEGGIILDKTAFDAIPNWQLPQWVYANKRFINNKLHTIEVDEVEYEAVRPKHWALWVPQAHNSIVIRPVFEDDDFHLIEEIADNWIRISNITVIIVNNTTGERIFRGV